MKNLLKILWFFFIGLHSAVALENTDLKKLHDEVNKTLKSNPREALKLSREEILLAQKSGDAYAEAVGYLDLGKCFWVLGDYPQSLKLHLKALGIFESIDSLGGIISSYNDISLIYLEQGDYRKTLKNLFKARELNKNYKHKRVETILLVNIGEAYLKLNSLDSAGIYTQNAYASALETNDTTSIYAILNNLGTIYLEQNKGTLALEHYKLSLDLARLQNDQRYMAEILVNIGNYYVKTGQIDSCLFVSYQAYHISKTLNSGKRISDAAHLLQTAHKLKNQLDSALYYSEVISIIRDSISNNEKIRQVQNLAFLEEIRQDQLTEEKEKQSKAREDLIQYLIISLIILILFSLLILLRKKKINFRYVEILSTIGLLLLFEFIALLAHPLIANLTDHTPYLMLVILTLIASLLVPLHHTLLSLSKKHLVIRTRRRIKNK